MRLSDLQNKDIINVIDGKKIGIIIDITINEDGTLSSLIVEKNKSLLSRFSSSSELEIKWKQITKIGSDVILVSITDFN
ncbi:MAG: YlmC/YmxH family sporulation protein [Bacilli bacterium]|nr:YlmC/YmxH family sporulation protein [Bacilli bacterium]